MVILYKQMLHLSYTADMERGIKDISRKISKIGWFGVIRVHSRSLKIAPFDGVHTSFFSIPQ